MNISIINILNHQLASIVGIQIKICVFNKELNEFLNWGKSELWGQVSLNHDYAGKAIVFIKDQYHPDVDLPCMTSLILNQ